MITATHIKSGHTGEIQDEMSALNGQPLFYFEDHARPTASGWYYSRELEIPHVNRLSDDGE